MIKKEFGKEWMHGTAVSSLKGRLRLSVPGLEFLFEEIFEVKKQKYDLNEYRGK